MNIAFYLFEKSERLSDAYPLPGLRVHAGAGCGRRFDDVAFILEPDNPNPLLVLNGPLGLSGVQAILDAWNKHPMPGVPVKTTAPSTLLVVGKGPG